MNILAIATVSGLEQRNGRRTWEGEEKLLKEKFPNKNFLINRPYNADIVQVIVIDNIMYAPEGFINHEFEE